VGSGEQIPERALKAVGTKPGVKHEGSVKTLIEDQKDLEIASVALNPEQVGLYGQRWIGVVGRCSNVTQFNS
jgi:hypothetical protein